jgi:hypothetical protein
MCSERIEQVPTIHLAGYPVPDRDVLELARLVVAPTDPRLADRLDQAYVREVRVLGLEILEREAILQALDDPSSKALAALRAVLLQEHVGRVRGGLNWRQ